MSRPISPEERAARPQSRPNNTETIGNGFYVEAWDPIWKEVIGVAMVVKMHWEGASCARAEIQYKNGKTAYFPCTDLYPIDIEAYKSGDPQAER